jgi:hypothetical protein
MPCSGFDLPCQQPLYISPDYDARSNFRLLLTHYLGLKGLVSAAQEQPSENSKFVEYKNALDELLRGKGLPALEINFYDDSYYIGPGGCQSNNYDAALQLAKAVAADPTVTAGYRDVFVPRHQIIGLCKYSTPDVGKVEIIPAIDRLKSLPGTGDYPFYLEGLVAFYTEDYDHAIDLFARLQKSRSLWIAETSSYLIGRTLLIATQKDWSWNYEVLDKRKLKQAEEAFLAYLKRFPRGLYADSAANINRRIYLLAQDQESLNKALLQQLRPRFTAFLNRVKMDDSTCRLAQETFIHYRVPAEIPYEDPVLAAYTIFSRESLSESVLEELELNRPSFKAYPDLYQLVRNFILYHQKNYAEIVNTFGHSDIRDDEISIANHVLLAKSLENINNYPAARAIWRSIGKLPRTYRLIGGESKQGVLELELAKPCEFRIMDNYLQISLARNYLSAEGITLLASKYSDVIDRSIFNELFNYVANDDDLENMIFSDDVASEISEMALSTLLDRHLLEKRYDRFLVLLERLSQPGFYGEVETAARTLSQNPLDPKGLLNMGYFIFLHRITPFKIALCEKSQFLQEFRHLRTDKPVISLAEPPFRYYEKALAQFGSKDKDEVEAKLLHYLILSFKSGETNYYSTWHQVPPEENKGREWLVLLKKKYPSSVWTKKTKYYY